MEKPTLNSPLKIGFLVVALAYFLFTAHTMFTLSWIGEWESFSGTLSFIIFVEDISAVVGVAFRLVASAAALGGIILYLKRGLSRQSVFRLLRVVLVGEAVYWLGLLVSGVLPLLSTLGFTIWRVDGHISTLPILTSLFTNEIPVLVASIAIPAVLFKLTYELNPSKPIKGAAKWGLIAGATYLFVFWLNNTSLWTLAVMRQGTKYLVNYPENLFSFVLSVICVLALTIYLADFAKKQAGTCIQNLNLRAVGAIITSLGLLCLLNYLTWIFFGRDEIWSNWWAWFLGHNLNLWLLSLPLVGLPLLFRQKHSKDDSQIN